MDDVCIISFYYQQHYATKQLLLLYVAVNERNKEKNEDFQFQLQAISYPYF